MKITIINGPNLNMLGSREPSIYGNTSFEQYLNQLCRQYPDVDIDYYQSNIEGVLIDKLQEAGFESDGIILTPAHTHTPQWRCSTAYAPSAHLSSRCTSATCTSARSSATSR